MRRIGVDVGGTFTDVVFEVDGDLRVAKVPSTRPDQSDGVLAGLDRLDVDAAGLDRFGHGTTVSTNAVLERAGGRTILVTTAGFRDLLEIGRQHRPRLYDLGASRHPPLVPRELVVEAAERLAADGTVVTPLEDPGDVAERVRDREPESVAICLLHSFRDDRHERAIADRLDGLAVSRSSDVLPVFREYERASTTVLNAYVAPRISGYLRRLDTRLSERGLACGVDVMRSGGGTFAAGLAARYPVHTLLSGPAAGAWGAAAVARAAGHAEVISFDMGGTSTDVALIENGRPATTAEGEIDGLPFAIRTTDIHTVGAGGGSIAWRDAGGALRVGPRSAGADPGPAAYGRGGTEPTVTDAHLVLGRLAPGATLGGSLTLDADAAREAVGRLADALGLEVEACAEGIVRVAEANMVRALRVVSVERGRDPRDYALVSFGGAGPLHQGPLLRQLGCRVAIVPPHAGVLAALGLLTVPSAADLVRTRLVPIADADPASLESGWQALEDEATATLESQGVEVARARRTADCRYRGQAYELEVQGEGTDPGRLAGAFHAAHDERYGYSQPDEDVELVNLRVRVEGPQPEPPLPEIAPGKGAASARSGSRRVVVDGAAHDATVLVRERLGAGDAVEGPAIIEGTDTTCLVLPGQRAGVDRIGTLVVREARG